ncbi:MAG: aspartyl/asparaginyl beta-hydroxylase domain-containing protein [Alcanivoracaceae bacterium]|jgi:beta-hydroxylase|nr:aspartyl/asparaginyl beta-hydroxylase domain-containing protein [Alcanivoracaceae bacterium]
MMIVISILAAYAGCIVFLRVRNRVSFELGRQLTDFSTFMVPFNIPAYLLSRVPTTAQLSSEYFPELKILEDNWEVIRDEALALYGQGHIAVKDDLPASSFYKDNRWKSFYLKIYNNDIPSAYQLAPKTRALIDQVPGMNIALFAVLMPGKRLNKHHDPFAYTVRYSLGLSTPNDKACGLMINGDHYTWKDGESIIFDETYLHSAYNDTDKPRIILMTDIDRPLRPRFVQWLYYYFGSFFNSLFYIDNIDSSRSGIGNRLGKGVLAYKDMLKKVKRWNRPLYVIGKWLVILAVLGLIASTLA